MGRTVVNSTFVILLGICQMLADVFQMPHHRQYVNRWQKFRWQHSTIFIMMFMYSNFLHHLTHFFDTQIFKFFLALLFVITILSCNSETIKNTKQNDTQVISSSLDTLQVHQFVVRLYKGFNSPLYCGVISIAFGYKFKVIESDIQNLKDRWIVIIEPCPEMLGDNFFETDKIYRIKCIKGKKAVDTVNNKYEKENLPTFWAEETTLIK